ncbi:MAG: hypothetical protein ACRD9L_13990, partial [Bryobacteraceae bacterium]
YMQPSDLRLKFRTIGLIFCLAGVTAFAQQPTQTNPTPHPWRVAGQPAPDAAPNPGVSSGEDAGTPTPAPKPEAEPEQEQEQRAVPQAGPGGDLTLPAGTLLTVRLTEPLSSDHNQAGDGFTAVLQQPLVADGLVVARRGQTVIGRVSVAEKAGRVKGVSRLGLVLGELTLVDGHQLPVHTEMFAHNGETSYGRDGVGIGATTATGAAIGAAVNGGVGAGVGAAAGLVASIAGVMMTRGRQTVIYPETLLTFRLTAPVTISTAQSAAAFQPPTPQDYGNGQQMRPRYSSGPPSLYGGSSYYAPYPAYGYYPYYPGLYGYGWGWGPSLYIGGFYGRGFYGRGFYGRGFYGGRGRR